MTLKPNSLYIKWSFSIGYFERYINLKSDYLELLLSVEYGNELQKYVQFLLHIL